VRAGDLAAVCRSVENETSRTYCVATLQGALESARLLSRCSRGAVTICAPEGATVSDLLAVVLPELDAAPERGAVEVILPALAEAFPCKTTPVFRQPRDTAALSSAAVVPSRSLR
jgi:hypothetical protein